MEPRLSVGTPDITLQIMRTNKESSFWSIACWCHQLNTLPDKCRLNWWLNCTKKFSMNPIEILEILAIAVHRFRAMLGLGADSGAGQCRLQPDSRPHIRITPILTKQKKNQRKLPEQVIVSWPDRSSRAPVSAGKLGLFLCCIEPAAELWRA